MEGNFIGTLYSCSSIIGLLKHIFQHIAEEF